MVDKKTGARIFENVGILMFMQVITRIFGAVFTVVAARKLGVEDYGFYSFATTFGNVFGLVAAFGFTGLVTREVARKIDRTGEVLGIVLVLESILSTLAVLAMILALVILGYPAGRILIVGLAGGGMLVNTVLNVVAAFFRAHQRMGLEAVMRISLSVLNMGMGVTVLFAGYGVLGLVIVQLVVFLLVLVLGLFLVASRLSPPQFPSDWRAYRTFFMMTLPFAISSVFILVYDGTAVIFLSFMKGDEMTGLYAGAISFVRVFGLLPASIVGAFLPAMSQTWQTSSDSWSDIYRHSLKYLLVVALPIAVGLMMLSDRFVLLVLGDEYTGSALILSLAAWVIILDFMNHGFTNAMISVDRERTYVKIVGVAMVINLTANVSIIPVWGAYGAVASSLLTEGFMMLVQFYMLSKEGLRLSLPSIAARPILSVLIMGACVYLVRDLPLAAVIAVGAITYPAAMLVLQTFDRDEIELFRFWGISSLSKLSGRLGRKTVDSV